jgi:heme-degrading monooxygenase HmoA
MKLRKDKPPAGSAPQLKVMTGGQPLPPPTLDGPAGHSEQGIDIPDRLTKTFRVTAGGTDAVMAVVMVRGDIQELLTAYDRYEMSVDERGGPDAGLVLHVCSPTADGICVIDVWESESAFKAWVARTPGQRVPKLYPVHGMRITDTRPLGRTAPNPPAPPPRVGSA